MKLTKFSSALFYALTASTMLTACNLTPDFRLPSVSTPERFKEDTSNLDGKWAPASKDAGEVDRSDWWTVFNDPALNALQTEAANANQTLQAAAARIRQADATYRQARSSLLPSISLGTNVGRGNFPSGGKPTTNYLVQSSVTYEADLFGRIRNQTAIAQLNKEAREDLYRQSLLFIHAQVAQNYYGLRALDTERDLLRQTITLREDAAKLIKSRFELGETGEQDYLRAQTELSSAQADLTALDQQRAITEHALAILVGKPPADLAVPQAKLPEELPLVPAGLPSTVLERRPDIAAAQKQLAAANAQIGIARAAFFPVLNLTAAGGLMSNELGDVFKWSSRSWMLGPLFGTALSLPIFDAGRRVAGLDLAKAGYDEAVANYRQQVLVSFQETEDALVALNLGAQQADQLYKAADAATKANRISDLRYKEGETSYLEVIDTQRDALLTQRAYTRVQGQRFIDTIALIRALGGGWPNLQLQPDPVQKPVAQPQSTPDVSSVFKAAAPETPQQAAKPETMPKAISTKTVTAPQPKPVEKPVAKPAVAPAPKATTAPAMPAPLAVPADKPVVTPQKAVAPVPQVIQPQTTVAPVTHAEQPMEAGKALPLNKLAPIRQPSLSLE